MIADPPIPREIPDVAVARLPARLRALSDLAERGIPSAREGATLLEVAP